VALLVVAVREAEQDRQRQDDVAPLDAFAQLRIEQEGPEADQPGHVGWPWVDTQVGVGWQGLKSVVPRTERTFGRLDTHPDGC
jgi:hypothetical protein